MSPKPLATAKEGFGDSLGTGRGGLCQPHRRPGEARRASCSSLCTFARIPGAAEVGTKVQL